MRKIDQYQSQQISDLINENGFAIAEYALEKDFIVTEVLKVVSRLENDDFDCVFCGGTCLSKAYGLLARISEDVDFKVISKAEGVLGNSKRRDLLGAFKRQVVECLVAAGFPVADVQMRQRYDRFIRVMVYGSDPPTFDMAANAFQRALVSAMPVPENPAH